MRPPYTIDSQYIEVKYRTITHIAQQLLPMSPCILTGELFQSERCKSCGAWADQARVVNNPSPVIYFYVYSYLDTLPFKKNAKCDLMSHCVVQIEYKPISADTLWHLNRCYDVELLQWLIYHESVSVWYFGCAYIFGDFIKHKMKLHVVSATELIKSNTITALSAVQHFSILSWQKFQKNIRRSLGIYQFRLEHLGRIFTCTFSSAHTCLTHIKCSWGSVLSLATTMLKHMCHICLMNITWIISSICHIITWARHRLLVLSVSI